MSYGFTPWALYGVTRSKAVTYIQAYATIHGASAGVGKMSLRMVCVVRRNFVTGYSKYSTFVLDLLAIDGASVNMPTIITFIGMVVVPISVA